MSRHEENTRESKKMGQTWLLTTVHPSLKQLSKLPNHAFISLVLIHFNWKELAIISTVSKSFSEIFREFKETAAGQQNFEQFLMSELRQFAQKQNTELKDIPMEEALSRAERAVEIKSSALALRVRSRQSNIYERAAHLLAAMGGNMDFSEIPTLSPCYVNILRILFILMFSAAVLNLYRSVSSDQNDDTISLEILSALIAGVTGSTLLVDIRQSLHNCSQQREVNEEKSQVSFLRNMHSSIYSSRNYSSINNENKTPEVTSHYVLLGNGY